MNSADYLNELTKEELIVMIKDKRFFREIDIKHGCIEVLINRMEDVNNEPNPYKSREDYKGCMLKMEWDKKQHEKWKEIDEKIKEIRRGD